MLVIVIRRDLHNGQPWLHHITNDNCKYVDYCSYSLLFNIHKESNIM